MCKEYIYQRLVWVNSSHFVFSLTHEYLIINYSQLKHILSVASRRNCGLLPNNRGDHASMLTLVEKS